MEGWRRLASSTSLWSESIRGAWKVVQGTLDRDFHRMEYRDFMLFTVPSLLLLITLTFHRNPLLRLSACHKSSIPAVSIHAFSEREEM
ncbi:hypothetical protein GYMLUDRAFT_701796 [Collybiopsis luxurians FD-317 M1]|uniref:Uncharacterized protein n=1 Tax=Collybiopsis luxurians FD-317 M1 TaxID=944289 RepID=A0A0D0C6Y5_9AGAR|nr:hypothetical protein GYMLUDRAFT_701796 [Collybiopsis luxurians FD-317 M1]